MTQILLLLKLFLVSLVRCFAASDDTNSVAIEAVSSVTGFVVVPAPGSHSVVAVAAVFAYTGFVVVASCDVISSAVVASSGNTDFVTLPLVLILLMPMILLLFCWPCFCYFSSVLLAICAIFSSNHVFIVGIVVACCC